MTDDTEARRTALIRQRNRAALLAQSRKRRKLERALRQATHDALRASRRNDRRET